MLPQISSMDAYRRVFKDDQVWLPAIMEIAARHGLSGNPGRERLGSNIVFGFGDLIVKLFPRRWHNDFYAEIAALTAVRGLPVPEVVVQGEIGGWPYFIVTRLSGIPAGDVWQRLERNQKGHIVAQLGEIMRTLHSVPLPKDLRDDWDEFLGKRLSVAKEHHNVGEPWRSWILEQLRSFEEPPHERVLLHGDLTGDHLLLSKSAGKWSIAGLFDFGDARIGHPFYEFTVPLVEYVYGEPGLSRVLLEAYGLQQEAELEASLTRYCLVHEFVTLGDFLERYPAESPAHFERLLWAT